MVQKQGKDEGMQEDYPTSAKSVHSKCRVVFLHSFISALFLYLFQVHPYFIWSFAKLFSMVSVLFWGVSKPTSKQNYFEDSLCCSPSNRISPYRRIHLSLATRLYSQFSHIHTASYQQLPNRTYVEMMATHRYSRSPPKMGGIMLSYSPPNTLSHCRHPQSSYM